jgi:CubicO group peptidase (beta-lactamase class C family)
MKFTDHLSQLLNKKSQTHTFSGVVHIQQGNRILFQDAYGYADRSWHIPNQLETRFRIASISKMFTAVAILQLIQAGDVSLEMRIGELLDLEKTQIPPQVNLYHLLTMTAGIADWFDESGDWEANWEALRRKHPLYLLRENRDYLPLFIHQEPEFSLGEKHKYSGASYILLGLAIEKASGMTYKDFVRQNVFAKAGMQASDFIALDEPASNVAEGYIPIRDSQEKISGWKKNIYSVTPEAAADGGATSTSADLVRFSQALRRGQLLSSQWTQAILKPQVLQSDQRVRGYTWMYGYANMFMLDDNGVIIRYGHTGEEDGVSCRLYHYPGFDLDVILLGNQSWCSGSLAWELHDIIIDRFD